MLRKGGSTKMSGKQKPQISIKETLFITKRRKNIPKIRRTMASIYLSLTQRRANCHGFVQYLGDDYIFFFTKHRHDIHKIQPTRNTTTTVFDLTFFYATFHRQETQCSPFSAMILDKSKLKFLIPYTKKKHVHGHRSNLIIHFADQSPIFAKRFYGMNMALK